MIFFIELQYADDNTLVVYSVMNLQCSLLAFAKVYKQAWLIKRFKSSFGLHKTEVYLFFFFFGSKHLQ